MLALSEEIQHILFDHLLFCLKEGLREHMIECLPLAHFIDDRGAEEFECVADMIGIVRLHHIEEVEAALAIFVVSFHQLARLVKKIRTGFLCIDEALREIFRQLVEYLIIRLHDHFADTRPVEGQHHSEQHRMT